MLKYSTTTQTRRYTTLWKMNAKKWHQSKICIVINDKSQGSIARHLRCDELFYYTFITQSAGERIFKIGEHMAKLQAKWLTVSYAPFALHFCPQRCWSLQINWITCVLRTKTVTTRCYVNRQINVSSLSTNIKLLYNCRPVLTYWPIDWRHQWSTVCWSRTAFCCDSFFFAVAVVYNGSRDFYMADVNNFLLMN